MQNRINSSRSFTKTNYRENRISNKQSQHINLNTQEITDKISKIYNYYYSYLFPSILNLSKIYFFEKLNKKVNEAISLITNNNMNSSNINQIILKIKDNIESKYNKDYQTISSLYKNYLKKPKRNDYLIHFRKHCGKTGSIAMHSCSNRKKGKFILIQDKSIYSSYAICSECKQCYTSDFILMLCVPCNTSYYSTILPEKQNTNDFPATWEKYHCNKMVNEIMKCIKCHNILYLDLSKNKLICKNKNCNFISNPESIIWNCSVCKKDFCSKAKVYNPLEFQILKKTINLALLLQKKARPKELPCKCEKDVNKLTFFHKTECKGILYQGNLLEKEVIVCSRCHAINFEEKFNWICPICMTKFYLHNFTGSKPFSKKKYIINREMYKSEDATRKDKDNMKYNVIYIKNGNCIEKRINNIRTKNMQSDKNSSENSINNLISNLNDKDKKNIINRNRNLENSGNNSNQKLRHYSTLKELLKQRESSQSRNNKDTIKNTYDKNKSEDVKNNISKRIKENMRRYNYFYENNNSNKIEKENYTNSYLGNNRNSYSSSVNNKYKENNINNSNIISVESPKLIDKYKNNIKAQYDSINISTNKTTNSQNSKDNMAFSSNNSKLNIRNSNITNDLSKLNSFSSWNRKSNPNGFFKNNINSFRVSYRNKTKKNENDEQLYQGYINDFNNNEKFDDNYNSNPPVRYSIVNQIKNINSFNINININTSENQTRKINDNNFELKVSEKNKDSNELFDEELVDKFEAKTKEQYSKKNLRESLMIKFKDYSFSQNIIITKEKIDILSKQTKIPIINETDYTFIDEIGEGIYGEVYLVKNNSTNEQYAMKKIICRDYNELIKHKSELELLFNIKHDNILEILGIEFKSLDETTGLIYILMELAYTDWNKEIKRRILAKKYYKENELIDLLKQIIKGFLFLQKKNIAHRDIKPQNILLFPDNKYKICDFGEAKNIKNKTDQSTLRGSELYMSPLLYKGFKYNQKKVVHNPYKSDAFSLGYCLLYAICLNIKVLENIRELNTLRSVINEINKFNINNRYSDKFMKLIYGMIEPNEEIRYDFEDVSFELNKI